MSSIMSFGAHLHAAHQQILRPCLPEFRMGLFQARACNETWRGGDFDDGTPEESLFEMTDRMARTLHRCTALGNAGSPRRPSIAGILPSTTTTSTIVPGSYVLEMPTQEDRTAIVIFPPGPQSLQDIRFMLGGGDGDDDDDSRMKTQLLKRASVTASGGFKILLGPS